MKFSAPSVYSRLLAFAVGCSVPLAGPQAHACTIFVVTDTEHALFFNNEDYSNPVTRLWFVPGGDDYFGCAYVGYDDGWAQGGCNTEGLAFDWVAGAMEIWEPDSTMQRVRGNPAERMLETCTTVADAMEFFRTHREPGFARGRILIADRSGASVIIGVKAGKLQTKVSHVSRGFGYGARPLAEHLAKSSKPTVTQGFEILRACAQSGRDATKYANAFDLKTGAIFLAPSPAGEAPVQLALATELAKGGHYYDLPKIHEQLTAPIQPLLPNATRFYLDQFTQLADHEPAVTERIRRMIQEAAQGRMQAEDYTVEFWRQISSKQAEMRAQLGQLGDLVALKPVGHSAQSSQRSHRYLLEFTKARALQSYDFVDGEKLTGIRSEFVELSRDSDTGP